MKIERVIAINFGALRQGDYELGQANLIVGKNGAGKSTVQDLIQIVMAGNDHNLIRLNPAQDAESRKNRRRVTKRSLAAYAVNMTDDGPGRPLGAICVIGLVFQPDPDENAEPMTALWFADVVPDQMLGERKTTFRVREEFGALVRRPLNASDFQMRKGTGHWHIPSLDEINDALLSRYPRGAVLSSIPKRTYVSRLHEWLSGGALATKHEAERATRAFIQSISLKDITDVDSIVRERVLDNMDLSIDIQETATTLRDLDQLQQESERLQYLEQELVAADKHARDIVDAIRDGHIHHAAESMLQRDRIKERCQQAVIALADLDIQHNVQRVRSDQLQQRSTDAEGRYLYESGRASAHATLQNENDLLIQIEASAVARTRAAAEILNNLQRGQALSSLDGLLTKICSDRPSALIDTAGPVAFQFGALLRLRSELLTQIRSFSADLPTIAFESLEDSILKHDNHIAALAGDGESGFDRLRDAAVDSLSTINMELGRARDHHAELRSQLADCESGVARTPPAIKEALAYLKRELAAAHPRLLCDVVRPKPGTMWQGAIEGLLGGARFTVIIDPDHESAAHALLREWTSSHQRARQGSEGGSGPSFVQSRRAREDARRHPLVSRSIVHELEFDDDLAKAFVAARYGSTVKITDAAELDTVASGLMADGRLSKSYSRRIAKCPSSQWVFGLEARRAQLPLINIELKTTQTRINALESERLITDAAAKTSVDWSALQMRAALHELRRHEVELTELHRRKNDLLRADPEAATIVDRLEICRRELEDLRAQVRELDQQLGENDNKRTDAATQLLQSQTKQTHAELELKQRMESLEEVRVVLEPDVDSAVWFGQVDQAAMTTEIRTDALMRAAGIVAQRFQAIQGHLDQYLFRAREGEGVGRISDIEVSDVWPRLRDIVNTLRSVEKRLQALQTSSLRENAGKIQETKHRFASVLTDTLVQKLLSKTKEIKFVIDTLNRPLSNLDFGTHRKYQIVRTLKPEFAEYLEFFAAVREKVQELSPADQWFGTDVFSPEEQAIRERIKHNLLNASSQEGQRELERIGNAANYYEYDLAFQTEAGTDVLYSEWGTGSGGENATPPYILCGMLVANACGWFRGKGPRLRLLMLDEAFKVHDLERSNRVIEYLQRMGFQLIVAAQMEKATSILPNFTTTMSVARLAARVGDSQTWISQVHTIGLNRDPLRALWAARRQEVAEQAELEFRRDFPPPAAELPA